MPNQVPPLPPQANYDKAIFHEPVAPDQLVFLNRFAGRPADELMRDKQFHKLFRSVVPDCVFHYGRDMSLTEALDLVFKASTWPIQIRENRYLTVSGRSGPYLGGRGFLWFDLQDGTVLGGFAFHPTNGEPSPSLTIFSRQVSEEALSMRQLPAAFFVDMSQWLRESKIPPVTTRYFIGSLKRKILLEHDEDFCAPVDGVVQPPDNVCQTMNADAADLDLSAAYYLEQTKHATNATAWMITGSDHAAWLRVRDTTCGMGPDPLGCRILMTRERTRVIVRRAPQPRR